jgi:CSLREA domain-containing protein
MASSAAAKTFEVTKRSDPAPNGCHRHNCSLREAILAANQHAGADKVVLPKSKTYNLRIENALPTGEDDGLEGDLDVLSGPLSILHSGGGRAKVDANGIDRAFDVFDGARTAFKRIVVTGGEVDAGSLTGENGGGGIRAASNIALRRSVVTRNSTSVDFGGGINVYDNAGLTLVRSAVTRNQSDSDSGGIDGDDGADRIIRSRIVGNISGDDGGGLYYFSNEPSRIVRSTVARNRADDQGGGLVMFQPLTISSSTIAKNRTNGAGGGINLDDEGKLKITNSTLSGNRADDEGGGIFAGASPDVQVRANAITVARNHSGLDGGGLFYSPLAIGFDVENSLVALNTAANTGPDCTGDDFDSPGHNLLSTRAGCTGFDGPGDIARSNPKIGRLKDNGGPTKTVALKQGSAAIGHAKRSTAPNRDQRGRKRDRHPDSGAYER